MGSFFTRTLFPKENVDDVKTVLGNSNFYICSKTDETYAFVSEEKMDEQNDILIAQFVRTISSKTEKPIISFCVHDSDVLSFSIYKNGKQIFVIDNGDEYFNGGDLIFSGSENVPSLFDVDENLWNENITVGKFQDCIFAEEFLFSLLEILRLPTWTNGLGYNYLNEDESFISEMGEHGIVVERIESK